jgi:tRNA(fMet)-specific endonuclease VapC
MTRHVLDTDILTLYQQGHTVVVQRVLECPAGQLATTIISVEEQLTGWYTKVRRARKRDELARFYKKLTDAVRFLARLEVLAFPEPAIARYEQLRKVLRHTGKNDLRIAAIVLEHGDILVTRNTSDFRQVPGLVIEDWTQ